MRKSFWTLLLSGVFATSAFGQGAGFLGQQDVIYNAGGPQGAGWYWGGPGDFTRGGQAISVYLDPEGDVIEKSLLDPGTTPSSFWIYEQVRIIAPPSESGVEVADWADWHEEFTSPDWEWLSGTIRFADSGLQLPGLTVTVNGANIDFEFAPIEPPASFVDELIIDIWKEFTWTGAPGQQSYPIELIEYPTPEPTTLLLLTSGGLVLLRRRR